MAYGSPPVIGREGWEGGGRGRGREIWEKRTIVGPSRGVPEGFQVVPTSSPVIGRAKKKNLNFLAQNLKIRTIVGPSRGVPEGFQVVPTNSTRAFI